MSPSRRFSTPNGRRRQAVFVLLVGAVAAFAGYGTAALQRSPTTPPTTAKAESAISANERTVSGLAQSALPPTSALGVIDVDLTLVRVPSNGLVQVMVGLEQAGTSNNAACGVSVWRGHSFWLAGCVRIPGSYRVPFVTGSLGASTAPGSAPQQMACSAAAAAVLVRADRRSVLDVTCRT